MEQAETATMFETGKQYKVKVEATPGESSLGRATIVGEESGKLFLKVQTQKEGQKQPPRGSRIWFIWDSQPSVFKGLWYTTVVGSRIVAGRTVTECARPKLEPLVQRRRSRRLPLDCPVSLGGIEEPRYDIRCRNVSRSGLGIEAQSREPAEFPVGEEVDIVLHSPGGDIPARCRVIRSQFNWLVNRTAIGLEFTEMEGAAHEKLSALIESLSAEFPELEAGEEDLGPATSLSRWLRAGRDDSSLVRSGEKEPQSSSDQAPAQDRDGHE